MQDFLSFLAAPVTMAVVFMVVVLVAIITLKNLIVIVPPNRAAVITGRNRLLTAGQTVGYRSISGGRTLRIPIIEAVQHMNLETIPIEVSVNNAFSKGNIPLNVEAIANVKIASEPEWVFNNAVERLLGKAEEEVRELAQDTLTGNLRGVLATLTPEAVNEDRLGFAKALSEDAGEDLASLGFHLDVLKIQNVSDERGYLEAIGREKSAEAIRAAEIAEAQAEADTREAQAEARRRAEVREAAASIKVAEAQNALRVRQAELDREGETAEKIARVKAQEAEVEAEKVLEMKRVEREEQRLRADVIEPAKAQKMAAFAQAEAEAAPILERGKAQVEVLRRLYAEVQTGRRHGVRRVHGREAPRTARDRRGRRGRRGHRPGGRDGRWPGRGGVQRPQPARAGRLRDDGGARVGAGARHPGSPAAGRGLGGCGRRRGVSPRASAGLAWAGGWTFPNWK